MKPVVTVIIPAYNEEKTIAACLTALKNQKTNVPYEIIVIDNYSGDRTLNIAKKFPITLIRQKAKGRSYARQKGVRESKGQILAFTEADCMPPPNWIDIIYGYFKNHPQIVGLVGSWRFNKSTHFLNFIAPLFLVISSHLFKLITGNYTFRGTNFAVKKSIFKKLKSFNASSVPFDDVELGIRAGKFGPIHFLPQLKVSTSDRRYRGRLLKFCLEFVISFSKIFFFKKKGRDDFYESIR